MPFKINISEKTGKTYKLELEAEGLVGKELHDKILGRDLLPDLEGYELEIRGASDKSGFTSHENVPETGLKRILLSYGKAMRRRTRREGKKKISNPKPKGLRLKRTVRGKKISPEIVQINLNVLKQGIKPLSEVFPEQNRKKETRPSDAELENRRSDVNLKETPPSDAEPK